VVFERLAHIERNPHETGFRERIICDKAVDPVWQQHADPVAGRDVVVNLATAIPPMWRFLSARAWAANQRVRTEGSAAVVDAALAAGVGGVVQESVVMLYADGGDAWLDEDAPVERYPMAEGNHAAEASIRRLTDRGRRGVVLRFGWFYGPGAAHSEQMLTLARRHIVMTLGPPGSYQSSIQMVDAGAAVAAALEAPAGVYNVVDDQPLTKREFADALAAAAGVTAIFQPGGSRRDDETVKACAEHEMAMILTGRRHFRH